MLNEILKDPVLYISFGGLGIVLALCLFYVVYFLRNVMNAPEPKN